MRERAALEVLELVRPHQPHRLAPELHCFGRRWADAASCAVDLNTGKEFAPIDCALASAATPVGPPVVNHLQTPTIALVPTASKLQLATCRYDHASMES